MRACPPSLVSVFLFGLSCSGAIEDPSPISPSEAVSPGGAAGGEQGRVAACAEGPGQGAPLRMRRLTATEYDNTVRDLLGDGSAPAARFAPDETVGILLANTTASVSRLQVEQYQRAAETLAERAVAD